MDETLPRLGCVKCTQNQLTIRVHYKCTTSLIINNKRNVHGQNITKKI